MSCDVQTIIDEAKCFATVNPEQLQALIAQLLCNISQQSESLVTESASLVPRPMRAGGTYNGYLTFATGGGATFATLGRTLLNPDYSGNLTTVTCPAADFSYGKVSLTVYGRGFGVRWYYNEGQPVEPFVVVIDGHAYDVDTKLTSPLTDLGVTQPSPYLSWKCPDLLTDERHDVEVIFLGDRPAGSSRSWIMFGVLLDEKQGYLPVMPQFPMFGPYQTLNTWDIFTAASPWDVNNVRVHKIFFYNKSVSAASISLALGAAADANIFYTILNIAAGASATLDFGTHGTLWAPIYLKASAADAIVAHVQANIL